ncbi:hypothetical protein Acr_15g0014020 [Actinidia rufa]|uniref:Uncharacterized protein n=1 Tax=Actinidia rufa TaxID=165716 RepID=A0A7J0FW33_9ERIC|nr:hypothetical protein Acr_15g0014020 [Actinidia rufa]
MGRIRASLWKYPQITAQNKKCCKRIRMKCRMGAHGFISKELRTVQDPDDPLKTTDQTRSLGLIVCRGTAVMLVSPTDGTDDEIANPFNQPDGA